MTEPILVTAEDHAALVAVIIDQRAAAQGWTNIVPEIPPDVPLPPTPGPLAVFSKRGPIVPMATIMTARHRDPAQLGIQHGAATASSNGSDRCPIGGGSSRTTPDADW